MRITINGNGVVLNGPCTVQQMMVELQYNTQGTAVAVNGTVVPRTKWNLQMVKEGDSVNVISAAYGG